MRILIVENHPDTLTCVSRYVRACGHVVVGAASVRQAEAALEREHFDAMISDLTLPDGDGLALLQSLGGRRPAYAIAMSGRNSAGDRERSLAAGFAEHLVKPFLPDELERAIERCSDGQPPR